MKNITSVAFIDTLFEYTNLSSTIAWLNLICNGYACIFHNIKASLSKKEINGLGHMGGNLYNFYGYKRELILYLKDSDLQIYKNFLKTIKKTKYKLLYFCNEELFYSESDVEIYMEYVNLKEYEYRLIIIWNNKEINDLDIDPPLHIFENIDNLIGYLQCHKCEPLEYKFKK